MFSIEKLLLSAGNYYRPRGRGQQEFSSPGTYTFVVPPTVTEIHAVAIGGGGGGSATTDGGGGGGGALVYKNNIPVTPGESLTVIVGAGGAEVSPNTVNGNNGTPSFIYRGSTALLAASGGWGAIGAIGGAGGANQGSSATQIPFSPIGGNTAILTNTVYSGNVDDTFWQINLPFNISFLGVNYNRVFVGSNSYITYSAGSSVYSGLGPSSPSGPHFTIYPTDRRTLRLLTGHLNVGTSNEKFVIRQEGTTYGAETKSNAWEVHYYPNQAFYDVFFVDSPGGDQLQPGISNGTSYILRYPNTTGTAYRFVTEGAPDLNVGGSSGGNGGNGASSEAGGGGGAGGYGDRSNTSLGKGGTGANGNTNGAEGTAGSGGGGQGASRNGTGGGGVGIQGIGNNGRSNGGGGSSYNRVTSIAASSGNTPIDFYPVTLSGSWGNFMNSYAVWLGPNEAVTSYNNLKRTFYARVNGTYTVEFSADNYIQLKIEGQNLGTETNYGGSTRTTIVLTAGIKTIEFNVRNDGGPAGFAITIREPNGSLVWDTRSFRLYNTGNYEVDIAAGGTNSDGADGGRYGGGGGGGNARYGTRGGRGGSGGVRIIWGQGRSYPNLAADVQPVRIGTTNGLVLHYDAGNPQSYQGGFTINDISGFANHGTYVLGGTPPSPPVTRAGQNVFNFPAYSNVKVDFVCDEIAASPTITVEMWASAEFNPNAPNSAGANGMFFGWNIHDVWSQAGSLGFNSGTGDIYGITSARVQELNISNRWTHYVFVMKAGNYLTNKIYINGVQQTLGQVYSTQNPDRVNFNGGAGRIGGWRYDDSYHQVMDLAVFKIYNRELGQNEVQTLYNENVLRFSNNSIGNGLLVHLDAANNGSYPRTTTYTGSISYSLGAGGAGGVDANAGANGSVSTLTYGGITLTANGGAGGTYNTNVDAQGGTATGGVSNAVGGRGGVGNGRSGDIGGGGGGAINGSNAVAQADQRAGANGGSAVDFNGLAAALVGSGFSLGTGGTGGSTASSPINAINGGSATGIGAGGGGAGWYGGNGGNGSYGGGGGGAAGYTAPNMIGGTGGQGILVLRINDATTVVLTSGTSYSLPSNVTSLKAWLIGGGGGGAGSTASDGVAGGGGGAGGIVYYAWTGGGRVWYDISGNNNHFNFVGNGIQWRDQNGGVIDLNLDTRAFGGSYVLGPDDSVETRGDMTAEVWFKLDAGPFGYNWVRVFGKSSPASSPPSTTRTYGLWYHYDAAQILYQRYGNTGAVNILVGYQLLPGVWYHMVGTTIGSGHSLYLNGTLVGTQTLAMQADASTEGATVGHTPGNWHQSHNGPVGVVRLWNRGLTSSEIQTLYNENKNRYIGSYSSGLWGKRYAGYFWDDPAHFNSATVTESRAVSDLNYFTSGADSYSWRFIGYFRAPATGTYRFQLASDDASYFWAGLSALTQGSTDTAAIQNGGLHGYRWAYPYDISLTAGQYLPIRVIFGENGGADGVTLHVSGPGVDSNSSYGNGLFWHDDASRAG